MEKQSNDILLAHAIGLLRCDHSSFDRLLFDSLCINTITVISYFDDYIVAILISIQENRTNLRLSSLCTYLC